MVCDVFAGMALLPPAVSSQGEDTRGVYQGLGLEPGLGLGQGLGLGLGLGPGQGLGPSQSPGRSSSRTDPVIAALEFTPMRDDIPMPTAYSGPGPAYEDPFLRSFYESPGMGMGTETVQPGLYYRPVDGRAEEDTLGANVGIGD